MSEVEPHAVKFADRVALLVEATSRNVRKNVAKWPAGMFGPEHAEAVQKLPCEYLDFINTPLPEHRARNRFLSTFKDLVHRLKIRAPAARVGEGSKGNGAAPHQDAQVEALANSANSDTHSNNGE